MEERFLKTVKNKIEEIDGLLKKQQSSSAKGSGSSSPKDENYWQDKYAEIKNILASLPEEKNTKSKTTSSKARLSEADKNEE